MVKRENAVFTGACYNTVMSQPRTRWHVFDTAEPLLVWRVRLPLPARANDENVAGLMAELLEVLDTTGLVRARAPLPTEAAVLEGVADRSSSVVTVRDEHGEVVDVEEDDAGSLLRRIEGPGLDAAYARRFAATGRPFVAAWVSLEPASLELSVAFFSTLHFDASDAATYERNQRRLVAARDGLAGLCRQRGGRLMAPLTLAEARSDASQRRSARPSAAGR